MRITLVSSSLGRGGAERTISILVGAWADKGKQVTVLTLDRDIVPAYPVNDSVILRNLGLPGGSSRHFLQAVFRNFRKIRRLRRAICESNPDLILSFLDIPNIVSLLATRGLGVPVIVSEQANPFYLDADIGVIWSTLRRLTYPRAAALVCPTPSMLSMLTKEINVKGCAIPNPVNVPVKPAGNHGANGRTLIGMGRLVPQKGFDLLLDAFSQISERHPEWSLKILGEGPLRNTLEAQAESLGLKEKVCFMGAIADPLPLLCDADLFVFSSRFEGFGNALCEAMACGLPAVSFDCPAGPSDIIRHEVDGLLVPPEDVPGLAAALERLMSNSEERERFADCAPEVLTRFGKEKVLSMWQQLFDDVLHAEERATSVPVSKVAD